MYSLLYIQLDLKLKQHTTGKKTFIHLAHKMTSFDLFRKEKIGSIIHFNQTCLIFSLKLTRKKTARVDDFGNTTVQSVYFATTEGFFATGFEWGLSALVCLLRAWWVVLHLYLLSGYLSSLLTRHTQHTKLWRY